MKFLLHFRCAGVLASLLAAPCRAADPSPALIKQAAAVNGGTIVIYSSQYETTNNDILTAFNGRFNKDGLHLKLTRYMSGPQAAVYDQELRAGKVGADVLSFSDPSLWARMVRDGKITPYCSENFKDFRDGAVGPNCTTFNVASHFIYLVYNPDVITEKPASWLDLVDPKWKGKVTIPDPQTGGGFYYFTFAIYRLFGKDWFVQARANDDILAASSGVVNNRIMSGERVLGASISALTREDGRWPGGKGGPIAEAFPKEGAPLIMDGMGITKGGPNLAGAKVLIDWASSLEGQKVINHNGEISLRKDFTDREGEDLGKINYMIFATDEMDQHREAYTKESETILAGK